MNPTRKTAPTSIDVAKAANVSQSTVSRAFSPGGTVKAATRKHILKVANELGYRPNALARSLISGQSKIIAVVAPNLSNGFFSQAVEKFSIALQDLGFRVLLFVATDDGEDEVIERIMDYKVDGVILLSVGLSSKIAKRCAQYGIPVVLFNRRSKEEDTTSVISDNFAGGYMIGQFLCKKGYQRIGYISGLRHSSTNEERESGFINGLAVGDRTLIANLRGDFDAETAKDAAREMMNHYQPDAIFAANDYMAIHVIDVLRGEFSLVIGDDIGVVGMDNIPEAGRFSYQLTTVEQPIVHMVELTIHSLMEQIADNRVNHETIRVPVRFIERTSA